MSTRTIFGKTARCIIYFVLLFVYILPLYIIVINSFKSFGDAQKLGLGFDGVNIKDIISNYAGVFAESRLLTGYFNSIVLTALSVAGCVILASLMAFIVNRRKCRLTSFLNIIVMLGLTLPLAVIPEYFILQKIGLSGTYFGTSMVYIAGAIPLAMFIYVGALRSIPRSIDESAFIDGCSALRLFFRILFPLMLPFTVTVIIMTALGVWNDFNVVLFLFNSPSKFTVTLSTFNYFGDKVNEWNRLFTDVVLISAPVVIMYFFLQKYIISGMTAGAIKE